MAIPASTLRPGDILLAMDGHSLSNLESYCKYLDVNAGDPAAVSGDAVRLVVRRGDEKVELREVLGPPTFPRLAGQTPRSTGFSRALSVDTNATTEMCGGPLIDRNGEAVGIVIAWRKSGWMLALPADIAKSIANNNAD
jgi:S1-C subfamily serine protease